MGDAQADAAGGAGDESSLALGAWQVLQLNYDRFGLIIRPPAGHFYTAHRDGTTRTVSFCRLPGAPQGGHRMAYWQWGDPGRRPHVVVCAHGLARQGRDFRRAGAPPCVPGPARRCASICPDVVGRGRKRLAASEPEHYGLPAFPPMTATWSGLAGAACAPEQCWTGSAPRMGGLIGMVVAGQPGLPLPVPVRRLVLNDVGPAIRWSGPSLQRIKPPMLGQKCRFDSLEQRQLRSHAWPSRPAFGPITDAAMARAVPARWVRQARGAGRGADACTTTRPSAVTGAYADHRK